jgi:heptosyltransferase-1
MTSNVVAICSGGGVGDLLAALPAMRAVVRRFEAPLTVVTSPYAAPVLQDNASVRAVIEDDPATSHADLSARLRAEAFTHAIVFWSTARVAGAVRGAGIPVRVGQSRRLYSWMYTKRVSVRTESGDRATRWSEVQMDYARAIGASPLPDDYVIDVHVRAGDASFADGLISGERLEGGFIVFHAARGIDLDRVRWPVDRFAAIADALGAACGVPVVLTGSVAEAPTIAGIGDAMTVRHATIAGRTTLMGLAAVLARARAVVALDSGPMHLAAALGVPTVGIFALRSDEPDRWRPLGPNVEVIRPSYPCPPWHRKETCRTFACYADLAPAVVVAATRAVLQRAATIAAPTA